MNIIIFTGQHIRSLSIGQLQDPYCVRLTKDGCAVISDPDGGCLIKIQLDTGNEVWRCDNLVKPYGVHIDVNTGVIYTSTYREGLIYIISANGRYYYTLLSLMIII